MGQYRQVTGTVRGAQQNSSYLGHESLQALHRCMEQGRRSAISMYTQCTYDC